MSQGLAPRPTLDPDDLAALVAVAQEFLDLETARPTDRAPAWRFSGRWFNAGPFTQRRPYRPH